MAGKILERRNFIKFFIYGIPVLSIDWGSFPVGSKRHRAENEFDAVIIGSGLGGLSCAAAFCRQGFKTLVLEKHYIPGGYATTFKRPGGFVFDVSLHSTTAGERNGIHNLIPGFPEIKDVKFIPHKNLYRTVYPDYDIRVPQRDISSYINILIKYFPDEEQGIKNLFNDMRGIASDIRKFSTAQGKINMNRFPLDFPYLFNSFNKTWGQLMDARIKNVKLKAIVSALWGYYGLPPSRLASIYYAMPTIGYLEEGGYYPRGRSQKISNAFVNFIEKHSGKVLLRTKVEKILIKNHSAYGVKTANGKVFTGKVVISNANAYDTFHTLIEKDNYIKDYLEKMSKFSVSLSSFQVFLGLKKNLIDEVGFTDTEIFYNTGYDIEAEYKSAYNADVEVCPYGLMIYDNIYKGYSPEGKNTINIMTLQGYEHWKQYEADYFSGKKGAYRKEKERMADILIDRVEKKFLKGLSKSIEIKEIGTPLTNIRYTGNYRGAIYGWD